MFGYLGMKALEVGEIVCVNRADILYYIYISEGMGRDNVLGLLLFGAMIVFISKLAILLLFIYLLVLMLSASPSK